MPRAAAPKTAVRRSRTRYRSRSNRKAAARKPLGKRISAAAAAQQTSAAYDKGYDTGYNRALLELGGSSAHDENQRYDEGFRRGFYAGGDGIVDSILPDLDLLPEVHVTQILAAGIEQLRPLQHRVMGAPEVAERILQALEAKAPLSVVRLGDGELLTLAQETVMPVEEVQSAGSFLAYAGVQVPDLASRDQLLASVKLADIVGIPKIRLPYFQPLAFAVLKAHGMEYRDMALTLSTINYSLYLEGFFRTILAGRRVLTVGNSAEPLSRFLGSSGVHVAGAVSPVHGMFDIPRVMEEIHRHDFDLALVGAGIPAVVISQRIAGQMGKVAIDFGHLADSMIKGEAPL
ncbi:GT-D fold domain-containing protein [Paenibacillus gansuensis]|uniref:GT-D fold domain-containing glycosyltransferase n=1 Tax=Paenibacillus gansuensis TaxID=306542 RepID=A0ABW5PCP2_9BACL